VQLRDPRDRDKIRLTLSAEAGFNDGTAFPFVALGLGLLGLHALGAGGWHWWLVDLAWMTAGGLGIGAALGFGLGRLLLHWHTRRAKAVEFGEYLVLGLIGVCYGMAAQLHASGFLAVFAAGLALRSVERQASPANKVVDDAMKTLPSARAGDALAANPNTAPAYFAGVLLAINELLEHLLEVGVVLLVGAALMTAGIDWNALWFAPLLFLVIRPLATLPMLFSGKFSRLEFGAVAWFGIRGIGSIFYLMFAIERGLPGDLAQRLASLTLSVVALSILVHGVSVTPLLHLLARRRRPRP
jgi:NhaP-type Na+/H+ or K+/H+ antiporter